MVLHAVFSHVVVTACLRKRATSFMGAHAANAAAFTRAYAPYSMIRKLRCWVHAYNCNMFTWVPKSQRVMQDTSHCADTPYGAQKPLPQQYSFLIPTEDSLGGAEDDISSGYPDPPSIVRSHLRECHALDDCRAACCRAITWVDIHRSFVGHGI